VRRIIHVIHTTGDTRTDRRRRFRTANRARRLVEEGSYLVCVRSLVNAGPECNSCRETGIKEMAHGSSFPVSLICAGCCMRGPADPRNRKNALVVTSFHGMKTSRPVPGKKQRLSRQSVISSQRVSAGGPTFPSGVARIEGLSLTRQRLQVVAAVFVDEITAFFHPGAGRFDFHCARIAVERSCSCIAGRCV